MISDEAIEWARRLGWKLVLVTDLTLVFERSGEQVSFPQTRRRLNGVGHSFDLTTTDEDLRRDLGGAMTWRARQESRSLKARRKYLP